MRFGVIDAGKERREVGYDGSSWDGGGTNNGTAEAGAGLYWK